MEKYLWGHNKRYNDYPNYLKKRFSNRIQKIAVDAGFTCPNRDGTKGIGGCTYCNNDTFNPYYCTPSKSVSQQLNEGIAFFKAKYKTQHYLAYFQAYSNTYADLKHLRKLWDEALSYPAIIGLVIGTRPDCVNDEVLDYIEGLSKNYYIVLELGLESTLDKTLQLINRGHSFTDSVDAINRASKRRIETGVHMILGLPGESSDEMLTHADVISALPVNFLKLHQLQIIKGTKMAKQYQDNPEIFDLFGADDYVTFVLEFLKRLNPGIVVERFISESPVELLVAPKWEGIKNFEMVHRIEKLLEKTNSWQGMNFQS